MSEITIRPKNWPDFQHYTKRTPPWIKLHRTLLDDFEFHCLPVASKALAPFLWLLASECVNGEISGTTERIAFRMRMSEADFVDAVKPLVHSSFFDCLQDASNVLAGCTQHAIVETEREAEGETEKRESKRANKSRPASPQEVTDYAKSIDFELDGSYFVDYQEARGWKLKGGQVIKDWKACVRTWKRSNVKPEVSAPRLPVL